MRDSEDLFHLYASAFKIPFCIYWGDGRWKRTTVICKPTAYFFKFAAWNSITQMEKLETWTVSNHTSSVQEKCFLCASTGALKLAMSQVLKFGVFTIFYHPFWNCSYLSSTRHHKFMLMFHWLSAWREDTFYAQRHILLYWCCLFI